MKDKTPRIKWVLKQSKQLRLNLNKDTMKLFKRYFKKHLTIKTKFNPNNSDDVRAFEKACSILEKQGIEFERATEIVATEIGKKIYFRYSLITDIIIWVILPILSLIIIF